MPQNRKLLIREFQKVNLEVKSIISTRYKNKLYKNELIVYSNALLFFKHTAI